MDVHVIILTNPNLSRVKHLKISLPTTVSVTSCYATADSNDDIYLMASDTMFFWVKLQADTLIPLKKQIRAAGSFIAFTLVGGGTHLNSMFHVVSGTFTAAGKQSTMIFRQSQTDFATYCCTEFETPTGTFGTETYNELSESVNGLQTTVNIPDYIDNYPPLADVLKVKMTQMSFFTSAPQKYRWGHTQTPGMYRDYPQNHRLCSMVAAVTTFNEATTIYQFNRLSGVQTIPLDTSLSTNCQGRPAKYTVLNPSTDSTTMPITALTYNSVNSTIIVNTTMYTRPTTVYVKVRYFDEESPTDYYDHPILIKVVMETPLVLSNSDTSKCYQNPFPVSIAFNCANCHAIQNGIFVNPDDDNILITGRLGYDATNADIVMTDQADGFVTRLSETAVVEWFVTLGFMLGQSETASAVTLLNNFVYVSVYSLITQEESRQHAIAKLTYQEGQLEWAKQIRVYNSINSATQTYMNSIIHFSNVPSSTNRFMMTGHYYQAPTASTYATYTMLSLDASATTLSVNYVHQFWPYMLPASQNSAGSIAWDPNTDHAYIGTVGYITVSTQRSIGLVKINRNTGLPVWVREHSCTFNLAPDTFGPEIVYNPFTNFVYVGAIRTSGQNNVCVAAYDVSGTNILRGQITISQTQISKYQMVVNPATGFLIHIGIGETGNNLVFLQTGPYFVMKSQMFTSHSQHVAQAGNFIGKGSNYFIVSSTLQDFGYATTATEIGLFKYPIGSVYQFGEYECHFLSGPFARYATGLTTAATTTFDQSQVLYSLYSNATFQLITVDQPRIRTIHHGKNTPGPTLYARGDSGHAENFPGQNIHPCSVTSSQYPSIAEVAPLEVTIGPVQSFNISDMVKSCYGYPKTLTLFHEHGTGAATANNNFISFSGTVITVNTTVTIPPPGFRNYHVRACHITLGSVSRCTDYVQIPIILWPSTQPAASNVTDSGCTKPNVYPLVLGTGSGMTALWNAMMDQNNGNMLMCGRTYNIDLYNLGYGELIQHSFVMLTGHLGTMYWAWQFSTMTNRPQDMHTCYLAPSKAIQAIIMNWGTNIAYLARHEYNTGRPRYLRKLQGTYQQDIQIYMGIDANDQAFVTGFRTDVTYANKHNIVTKIDLTSDPPRQLWYSHMTIAPAGAGQKYWNKEVVFSTVSDSLFAQGHIYKAASQWVWHVIKYDKTTGEPLVIKNFEPYDTEAHPQIEIDGAYVYFSYSKPQSSFMQRYMFKLDDDLVEQAKVFFQYPSAGSTQQWLDQVFDNDYIYEFFTCQYAGEKFLFKYNKTDLTLLNMKRNYAVNEVGYRLRIFLYSGNLYLNYETPYVINSWNGIVLTRVTQNFDTDSSCYYFYDVDPLPTSMTNLTSTIYNSYTNSVVRGAWNLEFYLGSYAELITASKPNLFKWSENTYQAGCKRSIPYLPQQYINQVAIVNTGPQTYTFDWPQVCSGVVLTLSWSVHGFASIPTFLSLANGTDESTLTMNPTAATQLGMYTILLTFVPDGVAANALSTSFVVQVYPATPYNASNATPECASNIWPLHFHGVQGTSPSGTMFYSLDVDSAGLNLILCGATKDELTQVVNYNRAYIQSMTINAAVHFHYTMEEWSNQEGRAFQCLYGMNEDIKVASRVGTNKIILYSFTKEGKLQDTKQITGSSFTFNQYETNTANGDQYIVGQSTWPQLQFSTSSHGIVIKLDKDNNVIYMTAMFISTVEFQGISLDKVNTKVYVLSQMWYSPWRGMGVHKLDDLTGSQEWSRHLWASNFVESRNPTNQNTMGIVYVDPYVYTLLMYHTWNSVASNEYFLSKISSAGVHTASIESNLGAVVPYSATVGYSPTHNRLVTCFHYYEFLRVSFFNITGTSLTYVSYTFKPSYTEIMLQKGRFFERNSILYLYTETYFVATAPRAFLMRFKATIPPIWDNGCPMYTNETTFASETNIPFGANGNNTNNWMNSTQLFKVTLVAPASLQRFITNPTQLKAYTYTQPDTDLLWDFWTCTKFSNPTAPVVTNRTGTTQTLTSGGFSVSNNNYTIYLPAFTQCQARPLTHQLRISPTTALPSYVKFDAATQIMYIAPNNNGLIGNLTFRYSAWLTESTSITAFTTFIVEIFPNVPPFLVENFPTNVTVFAHHSFEWNIDLDFDQEGDDAILDVKIKNSANVTLTTASWFQITNVDPVTISFVLNNPPQPAVGQNQTQYYIEVQSYDDFNTASMRYYYISLIVKRNFAPYMSQVFNQTIDSIRIPSIFVYTFWYQNFTDNEGDDIYIDCSNIITDSVLGSGWIIQNRNVSGAGNITLFGTTPRNNGYQGNYTFMCTVNDQHSAPANIYNITLEVLPKRQIQILTYQTDLSTRLPNPINLNMSGYTDDLEGEPNYYTLYVNGTLFNQPAFATWFQWNDLIPMISITPNNNDQGGNHSIAIKFEDQISDPVFMNFTIEVVQNWPLIPLVALENRNAIVMNRFTFDYNKSEIFSNPEGEPFTMYFRQQGTDMLPYFIDRNFSNGTIGGIGSDSDIGNYNLECVGVDDAGWITVIPFQLTVKPCYFACYTCWDSEYNTCKSCKQDYFLMNTECLNSCPDGTYHDIINRKCIACSIECAVCTGPISQSQCPRCRNNYYKLGNGCYSTCPDGYWPDRNDFVCKPCNPVCTRCYGPSFTQCYNCSDLQGFNELGEPTKLGYLLVGTECRYPKCIDGQYFSWFTTLVNGNPSGTCKNCHSRCKRCVGPNEFQCLQCYPGYVLNTNANTCIKCEEIIGLFTNEEMECEDICGDGIIVNKQCDDGNTISGDGCSSQCQVEQDYICPTPNTTCREVKPPTFKITNINQKNLMQIEFSEGVQLRDSSAISQDNIKVEIVMNGKSFTDFTWRLIEDPRNPIATNRTMKKFQIVLNDIKTSLDGTEDVRISFLDYSLIQDLSGNTITNNSFTDINPYPYTYISPDDASTAGSGGASLKYTFMSVFSFNIGLKIVLNSSMQFLWGLVHALQVFQYLLYLNIRFPENVEIFAGYLEIASGDIEEINQFIPSLSSLLLQEDKVYISRVDDENLQPRFIQKEINPYFIIQFGQKLTLWAAAFLCILPIIYLMNKLCKKVKIWEDLVSGFFFNMPLRGFIEMYIEIILSVIINTQFIKFSNGSQLLATTFAFVFGAISLLLPFLTMSLIYSNRRRIRHREWRKRFGMLTDECSNKSILQLYYYPLFMYQRLLIAGTIVYVYDYPLLQCILVMTFNACMIAYLIIIRPFKEESQQTATVIDEIVIMFTVALFIVLYMKPMEDTERLNYGWAMILLILCTVCKNFGIVIYFGFHSAKKKLKEMFQADDQQKDSPHTSDNDSDSVHDIDTEEVMEEIKQEDPYQYQATAKRNFEHTPVTSPSKLLGKKLTEANPYHMIQPN